MRILVIIHEYPPVGGGGGRVAQDLCRGLACRGHEVRVLTAHYKDLPLEEVQDGVFVRRLRSLRRWPFRADLRAMLGFIWASFWAALGEIRRWKPDVVHVHFAVPSGPVAWKLRVLTGVPYVLTAHLGDVRGGVPEKTDKWFRWIYPFTPGIWRNAAGVIAVSEFTRELALKDYPVEIRVIPNGVDLKVFDPGEIKVNNPPQVVFAGRFMPQKEPLRLVRALNGLKDLPWRCAMLGDGPLFAETQALIAELGLQDRFTLPGWVTPDEVKDWYRRADVLAMPSRSEGLPVVGVQALAMGLALVLTRVGGCVDLVEEGVNGHLLEREDMPGFEAALRRLLSDPQKLLEARRASRRIASRFDIDTVVESYEQIFIEVRR